MRMRPALPVAAPEKTPVLESAVAANGKADGVPAAGGAGVLSCQGPAA